MDAASTADKAKSLEETPLSVSHGSVTTGDKTLAYTAKAGYLPIKDADGGIDALLFHTYYTLDSIDDPKDRPLLIAFNGGPGSSSVWLHLGTIGPKRIAMLPDGSLPPPPYIIEDNPFTWLDVADIVFIDPVQTGFSHAKDEETAKKFLGVEGDLDCLSEFIRLFLTRNNRWASPLFMAGESYGTTRGAGLAGRLVDMGIALSGLILISTVLHFQTLSFANGNDLPYVLFLPTYAATAWYHGKLDRTLLRKPVEEIIREAEAFAIGDYASALMQGDRITTAVRTQVLRQLVRLTGLSAEYLELSDLRIDIWKFCKELRRADGVVVGRLDSRIMGQEGRGTADGPENDPSMSAIRPPYTAAFNRYCREVLGFQTDRSYQILGGAYAKWDWGKGNQYTDTSVHLRQAMCRNPHMQVFVASGYYDLATPHFAAEYTFSHMGLPEALRDQIAISYYPSGHMMYIESGCLEQLKVDVAAWAGQVLGTSPVEEEG